MSQVAIEQIEEIRGGEKSVWFAAVKGFVSSILFDIRNSVSATLTSFVLGGAIGALAMGGMALSGAMHWFGMSGTPDGLTLGSAAAYATSVAAAASTLALGWIGVGGAVKEVKHARTVNHLIDQDVQRIKAQVMAQTPQPHYIPPASKVAPAVPQYASYAPEAVQQKNHTEKLLESRKLAYLMPQNVTIH